MVAIRRFLRKLALACWRFSTNTKPPFLCRIEVNCDNSSIPDWTGLISEDPALKHAEALATTHETSKGVWRVQQVRDGMSIRLVPAVGKSIERPKRRSDLLVSPTKGYYATHITESLAFQQR
jgi:hypothetical protein